MRLTLDDVESIVGKIMDETQITDIHTHLYAPAFGGLLLRGFDELLTYHYLVAETFRWLDMPYQDFWRLPLEERGNLIWRTLFLEHSPISEACRGVLTVLKELGLDAGSRDLQNYRAFFARLDAQAHTDLVLRHSHVSRIVMTNDPFDPEERRVWMTRAAGGDGRFYAALRLDPLLNKTEQAFIALREMGYGVDTALDRDTLSEVRRFLEEWIARMKPVYLAVSLPPGFLWPDGSVRSRLIEDCVLPVACGHGLPFAMMIGVKKLVNKELVLAGDSEGKAAIEPVEGLCASFPGNKFMLTMLARENQHESCVAARKFRNLLLFGCWWFMNNPSLVEETTLMRLEMLGQSFIPQHSDARVLDQLIYKWSHSRETIARALALKYADLIKTGWLLTEEDVRRDIEGLLGENFWRFVRS